MEQAVEIYRKVIDLAKENKCLFEFDWKGGTMNGVTIKDFETGSCFSLSREIMMGDKLEETFYKNYREMIKKVGK